MTDCIVGRDHNQPFFKDFETKLTSFLKSYYQYYQFILSISKIKMVEYCLYVMTSSSFESWDRNSGPVSHWLEFTLVRVQTNQMDSYSWIVIHDSYTVRWLRLFAVFAFNIITITNISLRLGISSCSWILKLWKSITCIRLLGVMGVVLVVVGVVLVVTLYPLKRSSFSGIFKGYNSKRPLARNRLTSRLWNT